MEHTRPLFIMLFSCWHFLGEARDLSWGSEYMWVYNCISFVNHINQTGIKKRQTGNLILWRGHSQLKIAKCALSLLCSNFFQFEPAKLRGLGVDINFVDLFLINIKIFCLINRIHMLLFLFEIRLLHRFIKELDQALFQRRVKFFDNIISLLLVKI